MKTITANDLKDPESDADWIKKIDNGKYQKEDILATKNALANWKKKFKK